MIVVEVWRGDVTVARLWRRPAQVTRTIEAWKALMPGLTFDVYEQTEAA